MPFIPQGDEGFWDLASFMLAPVLTAPTMVYSSAAYVTDDYPLGKPDWGANLRNAMIWGVAAGGVYTWNYFMSPHNAVWMSGSSAWKLVGHLAAGSAAPIAAGVVLLGTPLAMVANIGDPNQGKQLQTAATGQPGVGSWTPW